MFEQYHTVFDLACLQQLNPLLLPSYYFFVTLRYAGRRISEWNPEVGWVGHVWVYIEVENPKIKNLPTQPYFNLSDPNLSNKSNLKSKPNPEYPVDLESDAFINSDRVGERGQLLSGGERQSVEIARVHNKYNVESIPVLHYYKRFVLHPLPIMCVHIFVRDIIHDAP